MATKPYKPSRPEMVQPPSEQGVFEPEKMRKELKGMSPDVPEPASAEPKKAPPPPPAKKKAMGGSVKRYVGGGSIDGCAERGLTKGRVV